MRAIVLVGGFGTRLRPLTLATPKPMLPVGHVPIIERLIINLAHGGVDDVTLALGFRPEPFLAAFPDGTCAGVTLRYAVEPEPLDTAGAIAFAAAEAGIDDTFVVANGDILTDLDVRAMVDVHHQRGAVASLHAIGVDDPSSFGVLDVDAHSRVRRFVEKPPAGTAPSNLINAGTYVLEPSVLATIPSGRRVSIERETFPQIVAQGGVYAHPTQDYWIDTGTPELYLQANLELLRRGVAVAIADPASVHPDAEVVNSIVAGGASVAAGAVVRDSVLLPGAVIERAASVADSMVMGHVGANAIVERVVIGAGGHVAAGQRLVDTRLPAAES